MDPFRCLLPQQMQSSLKNAGYFYLSDEPKLPIKHTDPPPMHNASILVNSKIIDAVMTSVQESETGSSFLNAKDAVPM